MMVNSAGLEGYANLQNSINVSISFIIVRGNFSLTLSFVCLFIVILGHHLLTFNLISKIGKGDGFNA